MKPSMIRWKIVPSYRRSVVFWRVSGWVHSRRPSARSAKLATVLGAWSGNRSTVMSPWLVCSTARRAGVDSVTTSTLPPMPEPGRPGGRPLLPDVEQLVGRTGLVGHQAGRRRLDEGTLDLGRHQGRAAGTGEQEGRRAGDVRRGHRGAGDGVDAASEPGGGDAHAGREEVDPRAV